MNKNQIIAEIRRPPLARNRAMDALAHRIEAVSAALANAGGGVRKGGSSRTARHSTAYLYATPVGGGEESRIFEATVRSSGFFTPISGKKFEEALIALEKLTAPEINDA